MPASLKILVVNGPNLNLLGTREPHIYGTLTLDDINGRLRDLAGQLGNVELEFFQSNHEGAIADRLHEGRAQGLAGCIINPGALSHTSYTLHDAMEAVGYPFVEVHISNIHRREAWRQHSVVSSAAAGSIVGLGWRGYELALRALVAMLRDA